MAFKKPDTNDPTTSPTARHQDVPHPVVGDMAGHGDTRHPLHFAQLRHVCGPHGTDVLD